MRNIDRASVPIWAASLTLGGLLLAGCGGGTSGGSGDMAKADLAMVVDMGMAADMAMPADMVPPPDLKPIPDLSPPVVTIPSGCPASATSAQVYAIVQTSCAIGMGCHGTNPTHFQINQVADLQTQWVNVNAAQPDAPTPYVTPSNANRSYLLYKLAGEQAKVSSVGGSRMPLSGSLTAAQICTFFAWVQSGAK